MMPTGIEIPRELRADAHRLRAEASITRGGLALGKLNLPVAAFQIVNMLRHKVLQGFYSIPRPGDARLRQKLTQLHREVFPEE